MRHFAFLFVVAATLFGCESETKKNISYFHIDIIRNLEIGEATHWIIDPDSIMISYSDVNGIPMVYIQRWTSEEKNQIKDMISTWEVNEFEAEEVGDPYITNKASFSFGIEVDSSTYNEYIYLERVEELIKFVELMDKLLPPEHCIRYNEQYLKG